MKMDLEQAIKVLEQCAEAHVGTKRDHIVIEQALKVIREEVLEKPDKPTKVE